MTMYLIGYISGVIVTLFGYYVQRETISKRLMREYAIWAWGKDCTDVMASTERFLREQQARKREG